MPSAISNTSPLLYLYRIQVLTWLPDLFTEIWTPSAVVAELHEGHQRGFDVPRVSAYPWLLVRDPVMMPSEWQALDLGAGERAALALALEHPTHLVLLDDHLARRTAQAAGLSVWGTLKILLAAKEKGLTDQIAPLVDR
ncbi:MAG: DUF3368 domain-containing protein, partial [Chloroflexia bacterium]|nr:DUF3368 domain-containing protein [Chloroflexia bacterium]